MTDDPQAVINHLLKVNRRWRAVAIAALVLVFMVLIPFTMGFWWLVTHREREMERRKEQVFSFWVGFFH